MRVLSINITSKVLEGAWTGNMGTTGIDKRSVIGPVTFANDEVMNDVIVDRQHHGGYDQAVYAYAREDADWWEKQLGIIIENGRFGENLTVLGFDINEAVIGERWQIGSVVLEVSQPRIPCRTFAGFWQRPTLIKEFMAAGKPGVYLRIIQEGEITAGDTIEIIAKPTHAITISDLYAAKNGERSKVKEIAAVKELSPSYRQWAQNLAI